MLIADLHIHSKYSRACSKNLTLPNIASACEKKGINLVAIADFTHPAWLLHIEEELVEVRPGIFQLTGERSKTSFMLVTELSSIYSQGGKVRRIHVLCFAPSVIIVKKFITELESRGANLRSDGRPILGIPAKELVRIIQAISMDMMLVPAHAWTPWFSVFGSKSGFDSIEECFGEMTPFVRAIETGLSSDPAMNRRLSKLDDITLISNSDAHGTENIGREANVFDFDIDGDFNYNDIIRAIQDQKTGLLKETLEFFPEEGKYHADGHADCLFSCEPEESKKLNGLCPKCGKPLTIGVLHRVSDLADRESKVIPNRTIPFRYVIPLKEIIAYAFGVGAASVKACRMRDELVRAIGSELHILLSASAQDIASASSQEIAQIIEKMRDGKISMIPGYDGLYGKISIVGDVRALQSEMF